MGQLQLRNTTLVWNQSNNYSSIFAELNAGATYRIHLRERRYLTKINRECSPKILSEFPPLLPSKHDDTFCSKIFYRVPSLQRGIHPPALFDEYDKENMARWNQEIINKMKCLSSYGKDVYLIAEEAALATRKIKFINASVYYSRTSHYLTIGIEFNRNDKIDASTSSYSIMDCSTKENQLMGADFFEANKVLFFSPGLNLSLHKWSDRYCVSLTLISNTIKFSVDVYDVQSIFRCYYKVEIVINAGRVSYLLKKQKELPYFPPRGFDLSVEFSVVAQCISNEVPCISKETVIGCSSEECFGYFVNLTEGGECVCYI